MTWLVLRTPSGTAIEHHALVRQSDEVVSRHPTYPEACEALARFRDRQEREALEAAGQKDLFGGQP